MNQLVAFADRAPALVVATGKHASYRFFEFFTAQIRNPNTCRAYARAAKELLAYREQHRVASIAEAQPIHVAATSEGPRGANAACRWPRYPPLAKKGLS